MLRNIVRLARRVHRSEINFHGQKDCPKEKAVPLKHQGSKGLDPAQTLDGGNDHDRVNKRADHGEKVEGEGLGGGHGVLDHGESERVTIDFVAKAL